MNKKLIAPVLIASATALSGNAYAQLAGSWDGGFSKRIYVGIGAGQSKLVPDTSAVVGVDVVDNKDSASALTLGFDFSRRLTAELQYADLGDSTFTGGDGISYAEASLSGLYYLWNGLGSSDYLDYDGLDQRTGLSLYGRIGVGKMENEALQSVQFERKNDAQLLAGLGIEYALKFGLGIRAEYINFDTDAKYRGVSVLYRFGGRKAQPAPRVEPELELPTLPAPAEIETLPPPPPPPPELLPEVTDSLIEDVVSNDDGDGDGINNAQDTCAETPPGTPVNANGCAMFNGTLEGVNFLTGSDTLTDTSRGILSDVVQTLLAFPEVRVSVESHTDSQGAEVANLELSRQRALSVVRYLTAEGIPIDRLEARAYGESRPIADNDTSSGRLLNRRVEFRTIQ